MEGLKPANLFYVFMNSSSHQQLIVWWFVLSLNANIKIQRLVYGIHYCMDLHASGFINTVTTITRLTISWRLILIFSSINIYLAVPLSAHRCLFNHIEVDSSNVGAYNELERISMPPHLCSCHLCICWACSSSLPLELPSFAIQRERSQYTFKKRFQWDIFLDGFFLLLVVGCSCILDFKILTYNKMCVEYIC